jgi:GTP-binding protein
MSSVIAIIGRPNVGKSTLFNRLTRSRTALVDDQPGITRDRLYAFVVWNEIDLTLIDTGGFDESDGDSLQKLIRGQVLKAIEEADRIIFVVDGHEGVVPGDEEMIDLLRRSQKKFFLAVNKVDGPELDHFVTDFYSLGVDKAYPISAAHGYGVRTLMEDLTGDLPRVEWEEDEDTRIRVAIVGRPNVGKSSLINRILGADRLLVSEVPGTTRDAVDTLCTWQGRGYTFIDTAGIRRKGRTTEKIEKFSVIKALRSLDRCHVAVIVLDASSGVTDQDARICGYAFERGRAIILAVNKWDLVKRDKEKKKFLEETLERHLKFVAFAPDLRVSALTGEGVNGLFEKMDRLYVQFCRRISTGEVNRVIEEMLQKKPPPKTGRGRLKILYATQTRTRPPTFVVFVNRPEMVHFSYERYITNQLRERLGLDQTPVKVIFRKK